MLRLIPNWQDRCLKCYICDTTISVKYEADTETFVGHEIIPKTIYVCNLCALKILAKKEKTDDRALR